MTPHQSPDGIEVGRFQTSAKDDDLQQDEMKATGNGQGSAKPPGMPPYGFAHHPPQQVMAHKRPVTGG